ncbi:MAG: DUF4097 family beta strand repeat-containing protein [Chloroflexi bacterium]|nr:DUF4097 family beta strand repeat-containing protein [Chloroflexota bacterium]
MATYTRTQEIEHEIGPRGRLALRVTDPDVAMRGAEGGLATVRITFEIRADSDAAADEIFERSRYRVSDGRGSLEVSAPEHTSHLSGIGSLARLFGGGSGRIETSVDVSAPAGCDLRYDGVSAELTVTGLGGTQEYRTVSGDIVLDQSGGDLRLRGVSSDISIRAEAPLSRLDVNTVSGDVSAVAPRIGLLRAVTISGDIEVEGLLDDGPEHKVETVSGDLSLGVDQDLTVEVRGLSSDADIRVPHRSEGARDRRRYVIGNGRPRLLFSSMSGDVEVRAPRRLSGLPQPPAAPSPPTPPSPPVEPAAPADDLAVLRALERGEIDVDEAARRLAGGATDV